MSTIKKALADKPPEDRPVKVSAAEFVDLVDSITVEPATEVGKMHLAGARQAVEQLRGGKANVCYPTAGVLQALVDVGRPANVTTTQTATKQTSAGK